MKNLLKYTFLVSFLIISTNQKSYSEEKHKPNSNHLMLFQEGTPNVTSAHVWEQNQLYTKLGHIWFYQDFPRGSNPYGYLSYTPIQNLQIEGFGSLRNNLELEVATKYQLLNEYKGDFISLSPRLSYNSRGNVFGAELSIDKIFFEDRLMLGASYSVLNASPTDNITSIYQTVGLNSIVRVWGHWNLFGDIVLPLDSTLISKKGFIWSAGIKDQMMGTPHNFTLFVGNYNVGSVTGRNISEGNTYPDVIKMGFEFSIIFEDINELPKLIFSN